MDLVVIELLRNIIVGSLVFSISLLDRIFSNLTARALTSYIFTKASEKAAKFKTCC